MTGNLLKLILALLFGFFSAKAETVYEYHYPYPDGIKGEEYSMRRQKLSEKVPKGSAAIFYSQDFFKNIENKTGRNNDLFYLTGIEENKVILILIPDGFEWRDKIFREVLFINRQSEHDKVWKGVGITAEYIRRNIGIEAVLYHESYDAFTGELFKKIDSLYISGYSLFRGHLKIVNNGYDYDSPIIDDIKEKNPNLKIRRSVSFMKNLREIKSEDEIRLIQKSVDISIEGHRACIEQARPGMREYELQALMEYHFRKNGAGRPAYKSIVASGFNTCILHYHDNNAEISKGDLVLMDCGAEYCGYASDITRTFPADGKFSPEQKIIYDIVNEALDSAIAACKPGNSFREIDMAAVSFLANKLVEIGIINKKEDLYKYYLHGTYHNIGLHVHDKGAYGTLQAGITIAVEPGLYFPEGCSCDKKWWNIGIRIEENILITKDGHKVLSEKLPRKSEEIEKMMQHGYNIKRK